jgi:SAM-dependent methyltransferase
MGIDTLISLIPAAIVIVIVGIIGIISITWTDFVGAPYVATPRKAARKMLKMAAVDSADVVYDLGSGDGRLLWLAAQEFGARAIGIEIDPFRYAWTRILIQIKGLEKQVEVRRENFFRSDLGDASVVCCYLLRDTNLKLMKKLERELNPGTRVVSRKYIFHGWELMGEDVEEGLYVYRMGESSIANGNP